MTTSSKGYRFSLWPSKVARFPMTPRGTSWRVKKANTKGTTG